MRRALWLAFPLAVLLSVPVAAQNQPAPERIERIPLSATDPVRLRDLLPSLPAGVSGILPYPLDKSLFVRGTPAGLAEMEAALGVIDVPIQGDRLAIRLNRGGPEAIQTAAVALPQAGTVQVQGQLLVFVGKEEWLRAVQGIVFEAELVNPRPFPAAFEKFGKPLHPSKAAPIPDVIEVVLPDGRKVKFTATEVTLQGGQKVRVWTPEIAK